MGYPRASTLIMETSLLVTSVHLSSNLVLDHCHSSKYNSCGNGQHERYNGDLQRVMTRILKENWLSSESWKLVIGEDLFILRFCVCVGTGQNSICCFFYSKDLDDIRADGNVKSHSLLRRSSVLIRNFLLKQKTDPFVEG